MAPRWSPRDHLLQGAFSTYSPALTSLMTTYDPALGDPVGFESDRISAIWRLRDVARQEGLDPAVWRAGAGLLKVYGDIGLTALPLGPDGLPLPESPDETPAAGQYLVCVAERDLTALLALLPELQKGA